VLAVAGAGPAGPVPVSHASGTVILAMDVSGSMAATDVTPSRLAAAKRAALSFIAAQPDSVDVGVVAFQQGGLEAALPTADHTTAAAAVRRLTPGGGTSLGDAVLASLSAITSRTVTIGRDGSAPDIGYWPAATIVLFSDGQDQGGAAASGPDPGASPDASAAVAAARPARRQPVPSAIAGRAPWRVSAEAGAGAVGSSAAASAATASVACGGDGAAACDGWALGGGAASGRGAGPCLLERHRAARRMGAAAQARHRYQQPVR